MTFKDLGLSDKVLQAVEASGYTTPTPIQEQAIPHALQGRDVLGIAQTGTGKTAAFVLPMICRLETGRARARMPRTLILEPTRELAAQVEESFVKYGANHKINVALLIGGVSFSDQEAKITRGADVLIATPGRLLDFSERGKLLLTGIEILVIDEADRMLDMGFIPDIERICKLVPFTRQTLFFSATMPPEITRLTETFLHNPVRIEVAKASTTAATITQGLVASHGGGAKRETLRRLIRESRDADAFKNAIIFCNRKRDVALLHKSLEKHGFSAGALHGDMDQRARMLSLDAFKTGNVDLLVCSDVAARGLDIPDVSHVFNFDLPTHAEDYVHRIGRTGRAGRLGTALSIIAKGDERNLADIEKLIARPIDWMGGVTLASLPEDESAPAESSRGRRSEGRSPEARTSEGRPENASRRSPRGGSGRHNAEPRTAAAEGGAPVRASRRNGGVAARRSSVEAAPAAVPAVTLAPPPVRRPRAATAQALPPVAAPPRAAAVPQRGRPQDHGDKPVLGMGDHIPMFMQRPVRIKAAKEDHE
jgi:superfamily II DNA/RNA helicase